MHVGKLGGNRSVDLTNGPIFKKLILFTFPIIFSGILQVLFNAADTIIVGNWRGDNALAAVSSNGHVINLFI
ncbi:MAG: MATE family efflux transporter, partial [Clostridia bacterium]|nr:MATE family efflux transporter [Clostridia bacterium]